MAGSVGGLCDVCATTFSTRKSLYRHMRVKHSKNIYVQPSKEMCDVCDKMVTDVTKHMKRHGFTYGKLSCTECNTFKCSRRQELRHHLESVHQKKIECKEMTFKSMKDFLLWKEQLEAEQKVSFIRPRGRQKCDYYVCHRSGNADKTASGRRLREPSIKIGHTCPATLVVKKVSSDMVNVKFYMTHTGHSLSVGSLHLTKADRAMVADLIAQGVPDETVLKKVRDSIRIGFFRRVHLLNKQDIRNIRKEHKLDNSSYHQDDATSVELWVREQERLGEDSPVIYYKAQGTEDNRELNKLSESDFMIVLMTRYQQQMAKKFCAEKVLIDSTHGTNKYKFDLTTLLTVDEFGAGFPVAYCISTHTDSRSMQVFFEEIKKCTGNITTKVFMSDDCESYYNAWSVVMGNCQHRLLCTWHVDRAWRRNICTKVHGDAMLKSAVYKALKTLHLQTEREKFSQLLNGFLTWCAEEEGTEDFGTYFEDEYAWRANMWAYSYRIGLGLNTNMYLEANHKTLKYSYLLKKVNNRVDRCIQALLHRTRDPLFQRLIRLSKGTQKSTRIAEIRKSHRRGCGIKKELIHCVEDGTWHVYSLSDRPPYTVTSTESSCSACPLSCPECKICVHNYTCSCTDNLIKGNMCKHIHAVENSKGTVKLPLQDRFSNESSVQELTQVVAQETSAAGSNVDYRAALEDRLTVVQQLARSANNETAASLLASFDRLIKKMRAGIASQKELVGPHFPVSSASPNETCKIQRQFRTVRKSCGKKRHSFATPSRAEIENIEQDLLGCGNSSWDHEYAK